MKPQRSIIGRPPAPRSGQPGPVSPAATPEEFERELNRLALGGEGWAAILRRLAQHTGHAAWLVDVHGSVLAGSAPGAPESPSLIRSLDVAQVFGADRPISLTMADGRPARAAAVRADRRRFGIVLLAEPVPPPVVPYLLAATTGLAIEAVRRDAATEAGAAAGAELVDELRCGTLRDPGELARAAARFGMRLDAPHAGVVFDYDGPHLRTWSTALPRAGVTALHQGRRAWVVLPAVEGVEEAEMTRLRERAQAIVGEGMIRVASGPVVNGAEQTADSFREAEVLLALLLRRGEQQLVLPHSSLGLAQLLVTVPPARLRGFVERHLGPLLPREDLVQTLRAWLAFSGSRTAVAEALHLHRNSVGYRVGQIKVLLGVDPLDPEAIVVLQAALTAQEILAALDQHDPVSGEWSLGPMASRKTL